MGGRRLFLTLGIIPPVTVPSSFNSSTCSGRVGGLVGLQSIAASLSCINPSTTHPPYLRELKTRHDDLLLVQHTRYVSKKEEALGFERTCNLACMERWVGGWVGGWRERRRLE